MLQTSFFFIILRNSVSTGNSVWMHRQVDLLGHLDHSSEDFFLGPSSNLGITHEDLDMSLIFVKHEERPNTSGGHRQNRSTVKCPATAA